MDAQKLISMLIADAAYQKRTGLAVSREAEMLAKAVQLVYPDTHGKTADGAAEYVASQIDERIANHTD